MKTAKSLIWYPAEIDVSIRPGWFYHEDQDSKVKSPKELMDIYFTSVGMNGVLLLNLPPNKEGKLSEADIRSLRGFRQLYANTFTDNLLAKAKVTCALSEGKGRNVIDDNYDTSVRPR